jgi:hypothetical protein
MVLAHKTFRSKTGQFGSHNHAALFQISLLVSQSTLCTATQPANQVLFFDGLLSHRPATQAAEQAVDSRVQINDLPTFNFSNYLDTQSCFETITGTEQDIHILLNPKTQGCQDLYDDDHSFPAL